MAEELAKAELARLKRQEELQHQLQDALAAIEAASRGGPERNPEPTAWDSNQQVLVEPASRCCERSCLRAEFLPIRCDRCGLDFCTEHAPCEAHLCTACVGEDGTWRDDRDVRVVTCERCQGPVSEATTTIPTDAELVVLDEGLQDAVRHLRAVEADSSQVRRQLSDIVRARLERNAHLRGVMGYELPCLHADETEEVLMESMSPELFTRLRELRQDKMNTLRDIHQRMGCRSSSAKQDPCQHSDCSKLDGVRVSCSGCHKQFCLVHRLPEVHRCEKLPATLVPETAPKQPLPLGSVSSDRLQSNPGILSVLLSLLAESPTPFLRLADLEAAFERATRRSFRQIRGEGLLSFLEYSSSVIRLVLVPGIDGMCVSRPTDVITLEASFLLRPPAPPVQRRVDVLNPAATGLVATVSHLRTALASIFRGLVKHEPRHLMITYHRDGKPVLLSSDDEMQSALSGLKTTTDSNGIKAPPILNVSVLEIPPLPLRSLPEATSRSQDAGPDLPESGGVKITGIDIPIDHTSGALRCFVALRRVDGAPQSLVTVMMLIRNELPDGKSRAATVRKDLPFDGEAIVLGMEVPLTEPGLHMLDVSIVDASTQHELILLPRRHIVVR